MSSSPSLCGMCDNRHISKPSEVWCRECEEGLCTECTEYHSSVKLSRGHTTIPIAEYQKLPSYVLEFKEHCNEHHEKFSLYCKEHECPCCGICIVKNHSDCKNVAIMEEIIKNVKISTLFNETQHLIKEMIDNIGKIRQNRGNNSSSVKKQKRIIENEIQELRAQINNHLDRIQENMMTELDEAEKQVTDETRELIVSLDEKQKELTEYQTNIVNMKKNVSDLQAFITVKQIEKEVETQDTYLQLLINSDSLNQTILSYKIGTGLKNITTSIQKFAEVVESKPCEMVFFRRKDKQAQMMVAELSPPTSIENIQLNLKQKINTKGRNIRGCALLPGGRMVFSCCSSDTIRFINKEGIESFQIGKDKLGSRTYDTVYIKDNNSVAVSSGGGDKNCIIIIDIKSMKVMTTIPVDRGTYGMAGRGRTIYYCSVDRLKMLNLSDKSVSDIISSNVSYMHVYYVATSGDKLYYTNYRTHTVTCCDSHGTTQWEVNDTHVLQYPCGITVDNDGNVYVVGCNSRNVVVISPDGQRHRQLLSSKDGLLDPRVLDYDVLTNRLLVANQSSVAFLFDVTRGR